MKTIFYTGSKVPDAMFNTAGLDCKIPTIIRLAGGMNNVAEEIFPFFRTALQDLDGAVLMSGGTRCWTDEGQIQASVAEVVADIGKRQPHTITLGSFPQTEGTDEAGNGDHTSANPETQHVVMIKGTSPLGWDGDVEAYINFMSELRSVGLRPAIIVWNGGGVTVTETKKAYAAGFTIFVITGTGRAADDQLSAAKFTGDGIYHISKDSPQVLRELLKELNLA